MRRLPILLTALVPMSAHAVDVRLTQQGRLIDVLGEPIEGDHSVSVSLWRDATRVDEEVDRLYSETFTDLSFDNGYYSVVLGGSGGLDAELLRGDVYVDVQVGSVHLMPRAPLSATPLAAHVATPTGSGVPSGAVMPFDLAECPDEWSEYLPARGRFVRGLDPSGSVDPDGAARSVGSVQSDELASHVHESGYWSSETTSTTGRSNVVGNGGTAQGAPRGTWISDATGGAETRPVNVALLYCRKD